MGYILLFLLYQYCKEYLNHLYFYLKNSYKFGYINSGRLNEKMKNGEKLINMLREVYYDILLEAQDEYCEGYPSVSYEPIVRDNSEFVWTE